MVSDILGTLTGKFYGNTTTHMLNSSSNTAFFNALAAFGRKPMSGLPAARTGIPPPRGVPQSIWQTS